MTVTDAGRRWEPRPVLSLVVRALTLLVPVAAGVAVAVLTVRVSPDPVDRPHLLAIWMLAVVLSAVTVLAVERLARRLLPLATLMRLAMLFPGRAPSRFRTALKAGSTRRLHHVAENGEGTAAEAAGHILAYAMAISHHDRRTRGHSERVRAYSEVLAEELGISGTDRDKLRWAALLHDVGKLAVEPEILNKSGRPDEDEWDRLHDHPTAGARIAAPLLSWLGEWGDTIAQHHERVDGRGYPLGLVGDDISLGARIVAVADAFEVMTSPRSYKPAVSVEEARAEIVRCAGTQFDETVVRALGSVSVARLERIAVPLAWLSSLPALPSLSPPTASAASSATAAGAVALTMLVPGLPGTDGGGPPADEAPGQSEVLEDVERRTPTERATADGTGDAGPDGSDDPAPAAPAPGPTEPDGPDGGDPAPADDAAGGAQPADRQPGSGSGSDGPDGSSPGGTAEDDGGTADGGSEDDGDDGTRDEGGEDGVVPEPVEDAVPDEVDEEAPDQIDDAVGDLEDTVEEVEDTVEDVIDPDGGNSGAQGGGPPAGNPPPVDDPPTDAPPVDDPPTDAPPVDGTPADAPSAADLPADAATLDDEDDDAGDGDGGDGDGNDE